ncbi:MAG: hypothetical protein QXU13_06345 [Desulfurococcaceae archaeon]
MSEPIPVHGMGLFLLRESGFIEQIVIFDYYDPGRYYKEIVKDPRKLDEEKSTIARNMQFYLDLEKVEINHKPSYPRVLDVEIGFRGNYENPYIMFFIIFHGMLRKGLNIYENWYEEEVTEYDYEVYWIMPPKARILKADLGVPYELLNQGRILKFEVSKNTKIRGYERIEFEIE